MDTTHPYKPSQHGPRGDTEIAKARKEGFEALTQEAGIRLVYPGFKNGGEKGTSLKKYDRIVDVKFIGLDVVMANIGGFYIFLSKLLLFLLVGYFYHLYQKDLASTILKQQQ